jgi:hypothetical protein
MRKITSPSFFHTSKMLILKRMIKMIITHAKKDERKMTCNAKVTDKIKIIVVMSLANFVAFIPLFIHCFARTTNKTKKNIGTVRIIEIRFISHSPN